MNAACTVRTIPSSYCTAIRIQYCIAYLQSMAEENKVEKKEPAPITFSTVNRQHSSIDRVAPPITEPVISRDFAQKSDDLITSSMAIDKWQRYKSVTKRPCVTFPACEGTWRAMNSTLTAVLSPGRTQHVHTCAATKTASPVTCVLHLPCTLTGCDTAGAGQHRLIRSAQDQHHRGLRTSQSHRMIYHHHARLGLALSRTLLRVR